MTNQLPIRGCWKFGGVFKLGAPDWSPGAPIAEGREPPDIGGSNYPGNSESDRSSYNEANNNLNDNDNNDSDEQGRLYSDGNNRQPWFLSIF